VCRPPSCSCSLRRNRSRHPLKPPRLPVFAHQSLAVAQRILLEYLRQRRALLFWAAFPALMLVLFGSMYGHNPAMRPAFDAAPAGILIGAGLFFSCLGGAIALVVTERERGTLRRLLTSPLTPGAYFTGVVLALGTIAAAQTLIVFPLGALLGAGYHGSLLLGVLIIAATVLGYAGLGFLFAARFTRRAEDLNGPIAGFGVPLLVLGGTFFPIELFPNALVALAHANPVFHMNEALKGVAGRGLGWRELSGHLLFIAVFSALALQLGVSAYRRMLAEERRA
jgi:ABC-2 type transport system permease protein